VPLPAGSLNHRIVIESPTFETLASGQKKATGWAAVVSQPLPASYRPVAGGETIRGRQVIATATALFELRWLRQVANVSTETLRLKWITGHTDPNQAPIFEILRCEDPDGLRELLMIHAKLVKQ
jgi:head-tail adaptor